MSVDITRAPYRTLSNCL